MYILAMPPYALSSSYPYDLRKWPMVQAYLTKTDDVDQHWNQRARDCELIT